MPTEPLTPHRDEAAHALGVTRPTLYATPAATSCDRSRCRAGRRSDATTATTSIACSDRKEARRDPEAAAARGTALGRRRAGVGHHADPRRHVVLSAAAMPWSWQRPPVSKRWRRSCGRRADGTRRLFDQPCPLASVSWRRFVPARRSVPALQVALPTAATVDWRPRPPARGGPADGARIIRLLTAFLAERTRRQPCPSGTAGGVGAADGRRSAMRSARRWSSARTTSSTSRRSRPGAPPRPARHRTMWSRRRWRRQGVQTRGASERVLALLSEAARERGARRSPAGCDAESACQASAIPSTRGRSAGACLLRLAEAAGNARHAGDSQPVAGGSNAPA